MSQSTEFTSLTRPAWITAIGFVVLNLIVKGWTLTEPSFYLDEAYSVFHAQESLASIFERLQAEANPALHFVTLHYWIKLFGISEWSVRGLSLLAMALTGGGVFLYARRYLSPLAGWISALLFLFSNAHLHFGQEARGFALATLFALWALWCYTRLVREGRKKAFWGLLIATTLLLYTHYAAIFLPFCMVLGFPFLRVRGKKIEGRFFAALGGAALLFLPNLWWFSAEKVGSTAGWLEAPDAAATLKFFEWSTGSNTLVYVFGGLLLLGYIGIILRRKKEPQPPLRILVVLGLLSLGVFLFGFIVSQWIPLFLPKYLLYGYTALLILIGGLLAWAPVPAPARALLGIGVLLLAIFHFKPSQPKREDWKGATAWLEPRRQADNAIVITPVYQRRAAAYYLHQEAFVEPDSIFQRLYHERIICLDQLDTAFFRYQPYPELLLVESHQGYNDPTGGNHQTLLSMGFVLKEDTVVQGIHLSTYRQAD